MMLFRIFTCAAAVAAAAASSPLLDNWEKEEGLAALLNDKIESSKTTSAPTTASPTEAPTPSPTKSPSISPTSSPSESPTGSPSESPTVSSMPSGSPSAQPTPTPSMSPSVSAAPTAAPSIAPSAAPSGAPTVSHEPTLSPSSPPSVVSSSNPSSYPSATPTGAPSTSPSTFPTQQPTVSSSPSLSPTHAKVIASSIIINRSNTRSSTPLLIVGACCFVIIASTGLYLHRRSRGDIKKRRGPAMIEVCTEKDVRRDGMVSPYSIEDGMGAQHATFDVNYTESESRASDEGTLDYEYTAKEKRFDVDGDMEDVDLENGRDAVPNSVSIIRQTTPPDATNDENEPSFLSGRLRMPKSIFIPKIFQRTKDDDNNKKEEAIVTWNQIREEDRARSSCSSGYAPASMPSPILSPFFVKGMMTSILSPRNGFGKRGLIVNDESDGDELVDVDAGVQDEDVAISRQAAKRSKKNGKKNSPMKEIVVKREAASLDDDNYAGLSKTTSELGESELGENGPGGEQRSPKTLGTRSSDSSIEWGIDVSKVASKSSFEANVAELQDILVSVKSMGSREDRDSDCDVQMTYTEDSSEVNYKSSDGVLGADDTSPKSEASSPYVGTIDIRNAGTIDIRPVESASTQDDAASVNSCQRAHAPGITFSRELMNSGRMSEEGTFNFRNIFNDPKNDLYECYAPSGPLGVVVDTTPLGPRVRSLNPLSPIFGKISPGDVIVGVDEVDTVGMEAGEFWKIVSRKANQQERVITVLRI